MSKSVRRQAGNSILLNSLFLFNLERDEKYHGRSIYIIRYLRECGARIKENCVFFSVKKSKF